MNIDYFAEDASEQLGRAVKLPMRNRLCWACDGEGTRGLHGLDVTDQCREDPDFAEDYFAGHYDTVCEECNGSKVQKVVDEDALDPDVRKLWHQWLDEEAEAAAERASEIRAGC